MRAPLALLLVALLSAPALAAVPMRYVPETHRGATGGGLPSASYAFYAAEGERIVVAVAVEGEGLVVRLLDPIGNVRETQLRTGRFELNADAAGTWRVTVAGPATRTMDYWLTLSVAPNVQHRLDEGLEPGDAPSSCSGAHLVREGVWPGGLWGGDPSDTFRVQAGIGDALTILLKPDELDDGADFSITLLDDRCIAILSTDAPFADAKSAPDQAYYWGIPKTGSYYVRVDRVDGLGNYLMSLTLREAYPTAPLNDAGSGRDPNGPGDAVPVLAPGLYQARLHDGDASDWFVVQRTPGTRLDFVMMPGFGSAFGFRAYAADMTPLYATSAVSFPGYASLAHDDGPIYFAFDRLLGGGNYEFSLAERPE